MPQTKTKSTLHFFFGACNVFLHIVGIIKLINDRRVKLRFVKKAIFIVEAKIFIPADGIAQHFLQVWYNRPA